MRAAFGIALLVQLALASKDDQDIEWTTENVTELIDNIIVEALDTEHIDNLDTCIKSINPLVTIMD